MIEHGFSPNGNSKHPFHSPLHIAVIKNRLDLVTTLLDAGANSEIENINSKTPLEVAIDEGYTQCVDLLKQQLDEKKRIFF